ncbi:MAG: cytochrome P450 [Nocardioides sp.]|nr:cytochrome P450 [Nocardioides sp.]
MTAMLMLPSRFGGQVRQTILRLAITSARRLPSRGRALFMRDGLDPVPALEESRTQGDIVPLLRLPGTRVWLVTGYDAARAVLADADSFANDVRHLVGRQDRAPAERIGGLGMTDRPDHDRLRGVLTPHFTRRRLADLQADIDRVVDEALDDLAAHGPEVDLVSHFGFAVPFGVICDLLGLPDVDRDEFSRRGAARFDLSDAGAGILDTAAGTRQFLIDLVAAERRSPHLPDGLISRLVAAHGDDLEDVELGGLADGVFLGGYETSASMLSLGTYVLSRSPEAWETLRHGDAEQVDRVIEELLRYVCPVQIAFPRIARHDVTVGTATVRAGDIVIVSLTGAERDPARHVDPGQFDPTSEAAGTLAFGHGLHRCVGAELARMELRTALVGLARRFPDLRITCDPADLRFTEMAIVYGVEELPVRLGALRTVEGCQAGPVS